MHICENTEGSFTCKCNADFKVDPTNSKNCIREFFNKVVNSIVCKDRRIVCCFTKKRCLTIHRLFKAIYFLVIYSIAERTDRETTGTQKAKSL